jgi:hypothetical protein
MIKTINGMISNCAYSTHLRFPLDYNKLLMQILYRYESTAHLSTSNIKNYQYF